MVAMNASAKHMVRDGMTWIADYPPVSTSIAGRHAVYKAGHHCILPCFSLRYWLKHRLTIYSIALSSLTFAKSYAI